MKRIHLTKGQHTLVSDEDYDTLAAHAWHTSEAGTKSYAGRDVLRDGRRVKLRMHRVILGIEDPMVLVDHIDGDGLNNCRDNLRLATKAQNQRNLGPRKNNTSGYRGVSWDKFRRRWVARITKDRRVTVVGYYLTAPEAARAYDAAARELFGAFCGRLNFKEAGL